MKTTKRSTRKTHSIDHEDRTYWPSTFVERDPSLENGGIRFALSRTEVILETLLPKRKVKKAQDMS